ncbi:GNAT family N-acetyltransferase [Janthinobacterium sp. 64]|uniref:GNAT family N-acetyltransferase n=1 Tax=Janthinobacterium sp. 64 TaxID=2035208 RepID=UPI000C2C4CF4|nr:GNAT family N-acetyltransferase [Janthinobacterium sp. 64]PKB13774.1 hypothetical protein CLU91_5386 [Janthinobacterium sp. 64]
MITSSFRPQGHGQTRRKPDVRVLEIKRVADSTDAGRVDWILVERKEELERDPRTNEVHRGKISVFYWDLSAGTASDIPDGEFLGFYDKVFDGISITSSSLSTGGYVRVDPPRLRGGWLGTYLMNEIVAWAKQWPDTPVREVTLLAGDADDPQNRIRRNRFYERFGLEFDFTDKDKSAGVSRSILAGNLKEVTTWAQTITEHDLPRYLRAALSDAEEMAVTAHMQVRDFKELYDELRFAERHPVRWIASAWLRNRPAGVAIAVVGIVAAAWSGFKLV